MRPYSTEDAFLAEERDTLTRSAITLIGAPSRPRGVVIRFELTLADGVPLVRGEGRVLGYQPADDRGPSSLTLRFTKLDARSKALVDRAADQRDGETGRTRQGSQPPTRPTQPPEPPHDTTPPGGLDALGVTSTGSTIPPAHPSPSSPPEDIALSISSGSLPMGEVEEIGVSSSLPPRSEDRDQLLDRLRTRARTLSPTQVETILSAPRSTRSPRPTGPA
jgi:hypothetical protein